jgi:hypothetical protein
MTKKEFLKIFGGQHLVVLNIDSERSFSFLSMIKKMRRGSEEAFEIIRAQSLKKETQMRKFAI